MVKRRAKSKAAATYVALLRGVNVGGKALVRMADLKDAVERCGFANVSTFIQSGNVIFESTGADGGGIAARLEAGMARSFGMNVRVVVRSLDQLRAVLAKAPREWRTRQDIRRYIAFIRAPATPGDVLKHAIPKPGIDSVKAGPGVVYMTTVLSEAAKSGLKDLLGTRAYRDLTIRNYNTARKLLALMESRPPLREVRPARRAPQGSGKFSNLKI